MIPSKLSCNPSEDVSIACDVLSLTMALMDSLFGRIWNLRPSTHQKEPLMRRPLRGDHCSLPSVSRNYPCSLMCVLLSLKHVDQRRLRRDRIALLANGNRNLPDSRTMLYSEAEAPAIDVSALAQPNRKRSRGTGDAAKEESSEDEDPDADLDWRSKTL